MANPFDEDDRLAKNRRGLGLDPVKSYTVQSGSIEDDIEEYEKEIEKCLQASVDSTQRSAQQLTTSEKLAEGTMQNLAEQREKLERAEKGLDDIHYTTQLTQRTLNSIKSVFGGYFKNKFTRAPTKAVPTEKNEEMTQSKSENRLSVLANKVETASTQSATNSGNTHSLEPASRDYMKGTRWEAMDNQIDQNLDDMSSQLARLRAYGKAMGEEVDDQNKLLDRIENKTGRNNDVIRSQDNQMRKFLK